MSKSKLLIENGDIDFFKQVYFDAVYRNKESNTTKTILGEIGDSDMIIDSTAPNTSVDANLKRLLKLEAIGAIFDIAVCNEEDTAYYRDPEDDFEIYSVANFAIAEFKIHIHKLRKVFQDLEFYPAYFVRKFKPSVIGINDKYQLCKPHSMSSNELFFEYVYSRPYRRLPYKEIKKYVESGASKEVNRKPSSLLADMNFTGEILKLFFPEVSNASIFFRPVVMKSELKKSLINPKALKEQLIILPKLAV
ncbi:MAG: hypothetical protein WAV09_02785 [Minisyncoccia bacterium]